MFVAHNNPTRPRLGCCGTNIDGLLLGECLVHLGTMILIDYCTQNDNERKEKSISTKNVLRGRGRINRRDQNKCLRGIPHFKFRDDPLEIT